RSTARVAAVFERLPTNEAVLRILKHDVLSDDTVSEGEYARQRSALETAGGFRAHLAGLAHEPIRISDGSWVTFQELAGDGGGTAPQLLPSFLAAIPGVQLPGIEVPPAFTSVDTFVDACVTLVESSLYEWARKIRIEQEPIAALMQRHLADRIRRGASLGDM